MKITYMKPLSHEPRSLFRRKRKIRLPKNIYVKYGIGIMILLFYVPLIISIIQRDPLSLKSMIMLARFGLLIGFMVFVSYLSYLPIISEIVPNDDGIQLTTFWRKIYVAWKDVIAIKPVYFMWFFKVSDIVHVRPSSMFDRIFLMYSSSRFKPCFFVSKWMMDYDALLNRVRYHIRENQSKAKSLKQESLF